MTSIRKYNNNIILANDHGHEVIVLGKGIGFQANPGMLVDEDLIEKVFVPQETAQLSRFAGTLSELAYEYILLAAHVVDSAKELLQTELNPSVVVALADHFSIVFKRTQEHIELETPLKWDIRHLYPREFQAGMRGLEIIRRERHISFPESEAVSIALHFINAEIESPDMPTTFKIVAITSDIIGIVKEYFNIAFDEEAFDVMPFVLHLRNMVLKYTVRPNQNAQAVDDGLFALITKRYPEAAACCNRICDYLHETQGWEPVRNDRLFLTLHIRRITENINK
ncbi:MAG: PRD domain-containing protein [Treponema sp.]|jgi:beta-glucoside operon transcriptional antiterminator|nr:PRD domain-containing protein [Treponema sp.]